MLAALLLMAGLVSCASEDNAVNNSGTDNTDELTTFVAGTYDNGNAKTRTSMNYDDGAFFWEEGDKIYVKDDEGMWRVSSNAVNADKVSYFKFMMPGKYTASNTYTVCYPGTTGSQDQVTIAAGQRQDVPDDTRHFGRSGDCGIATATKGSDGKFHFRLDHKAAYLVFNIHTENQALKNCLLTKIQVTADNNIAGTYTVTHGGLIGEGSSKQITLETKEVYGGAKPHTTRVAQAYDEGFPMYNDFKVYMVIAPGTHTLKVRYWIKDYVTNVEGAITKNYPSFTYAANNYYDMQANLDVRSYDSKYYMWDAQQHYWYGYENEQPTENDQYNLNYPQNYTDPNNRWYHLGVGSFNASVSCTVCPNANELSWYAMQGDPRWDNEELWTVMGHLYIGGMWVKKKAHIPGFRSDVSADGSTDMRTTSIDYQNNTLTPGLPGATEIGNYFYLPALGYYSLGFLRNVGNHGRYWSSNAVPESTNNSYSLYFDQSSVKVHNNYLRENGFRVLPFE